MVQVLEQPVWRERERRHHQRVDEAVAAHIHRRDRGQLHPIDDFLFTYYRYKPSALRVWHPGVGISLRGADERVGWAHYLQVDGCAAVGGASVVERRSTTLAHARAVLTATLDRPVQLACFGMHEWAMAYRTTPDEIRHNQLQLRLGHQGTDEVVESHDLRCTHFDAYRFFTAPARPLNSIDLQRDSQVRYEQPGCLHAGMDCYKWAHKLSPLVSSDLVMDAFELAREIRIVDMRASPYDVSSLGHEPIAVETPEGKAEYVRLQRRFTERSQQLRRQLLDVLNSPEVLRA